MKDSKKVFFTALLSVLFILSSIVSLKITVIAKLPLACNVFVFPFMFLCIAVISYLYGAKEAFKSVGFALVTQIIFFGVSILVSNVPNQVDTLVNANYIQAILAPSLVNGMYFPTIKLVFGSLIAFVISQAINIGIMTYAKKYTYKGVASSLSILISMVMFALIFTVATGIGNIGNNLVVSLVNQFVVCVIATIISVIIFCIFTIGKKETPKKVENKKA